jgi:hypothetical protein
MSARLALCPRRLAAPLTALVLALPDPAVRAQEEVEPEGADEIVAEALFLADTLPAGSHDLTLVLAVEKGEADPITGKQKLSASPTVQLAAPLGGRMGLTVDVGITTDGGGLEHPGFSLKYLLRDAGPGTTGFSASFDLHGSLGSEGDAEAALAFGALRPLGPVALRGTALVATGLSSGTPRLQAGVSAALALSARWRALAEMVADVSRDGMAVAAGPTMKVVLGESAALMAGVLFEVGGSVRLPVVTLQLTQSL